MKPHNQTRHRSPQALKLLSAITLACLLSACASQSPKQPSDISTEPQVRSATNNKSTSSRKNTASTQQPRVERAAPESLSTVEYNDLLIDIDDWQVQGKIGLRIPDNSGSLYFNWKQAPSEWAIHLSGPLGQGATWIRSNGKTVTLTAGDQPTLTADSAAELMDKSLGWSLPIESLYYWIRGLADPNQAVELLVNNEADQIEQLSQLGWNISYPRYKNQNGWPLPQKIVATNSDIKATIIIKNWRLF